MRTQRRILRELALAAVVGTVVGVSSLAPKHWLGSLFVGVLAGTVAFVVRIRRARAAPDVESGWSWSGTPLVGVALVLWIALFAPTWVWLYGQWTGSVWSNEHGIFIPFVVGYFVWSTLRREPEPRQEEASPWGFAWLVAGGALGVLDSGVRSGYLGTTGLLLSLPGLSLLLLGSRRTRTLAVPLAISLLMMPIPRTLATDLQLRHLTASGAEWILHGLGVTALRDGTVLHLPGRSFIVSDACSGFSALYAGLATAVILAVGTHSLPRSLMLMAAAPVLALIANTARVLLLVLLTQRFGAWVMDSAFHPATGVATFLIVLGGLWVIGGRPNLEPKPS